MQKTWFTELKLKALLIYTISEATTIVNVKVLARTWQEIEHGLDIFHAIDSTHMVVY